MDVQVLQRGSYRFPAHLVTRLGDEAPDTLYLRGDERILLGIQLGVICSVSCPGSIVIKTLDTIRKVRDAGIVVAGGFHSPMERECLHFLLRGPQAVLWCPAAGLRCSPLGIEEQRSLDERRLSLLSIFDEGAANATPELASRRNDVVAALADVVLVVHAVAGGKAEATLRRALARGQVVLTLEDPENEHLVRLGATPVAVANAVPVVLATISRGASVR